MIPGKKDKEFKTEVERQIKNIIKRLKEEREKAKISQMELSYASDLSPNQVNYIETGQRTPNLHTLLQICNALNINPAVLFLPPDKEKIKMKKNIIELVSKL
jgi:transcriptional regulator with XRE-family HTH domain